MAAMITQTAITVMWAALLAAHIRRLFRLAHGRVQDLAHDRQLRHHAQHMWWWLGRPEFWRQAQSDTCHCLELTLLMFLLVWAI